MKKIAILFVVGILVGTTIGAVATQGNQKSTEFLSAHVYTPSFQIQSVDNDEYLLIELSGTSTFQTKAGQPQLPKIVRTFELPFGARNIRVSLNPLDITTQQIDQKIRPAAQMLPLTIESQSLAAYTRVKDEQVYAMTTPYPETWFTTSIGVGVNKNNKHVTFLNVYYYPIRYTPATGTLHIANAADLSVTYTSPAYNPFPANTEYNLVIIAPKSFEKALQPLIEHKDSYGKMTILKTTEDIYKNYTGVDKPEKIKYFIKDAIETWGVEYVLLVGGLRNMIFAKPRDNVNEGSKAWHVPVRYTNLYDNPKFPLSAESTLHDPGVISDLYYADIYNSTGNFSSWDPNGDGVFAAWGKPGVENDTGIDLYPDVAVGRLACVSVAEVRTVVKKIITYETTTYGQDWFNKIVAISGDGFLDQQDLNIQWNTTGLPKGTYTIYAQSHNPSAEYGPIETINVTVDKTKETNLTFNHDDYLRISQYPGLPMAEIVTVSEGNVLGNTDFTYSPSEGEAYCNEFYFWANMSYVSGVLTIRGKSYDPKPYGNLSSIHVWIKNSTNEIVFEDWRNDTEMYYEGEYTTGEKVLLGRGGAMYYMPEEFEREIVWASNGKLTGEEDVINAWNEGAGFMFISGHGSPNVWADHYPGVAGNRRYGSITGLRVTTLQPWSPFFTKPIFPMDTIKNGEKLPITIIGGCHNSQFNVSMIYGLLDGMIYLLPNFPKLSMWCYGTPVPEAFSWRLIRNPRGGSIASIGNTGLGYGMPGVDLTTGGGDGWVTIEFFKQYGAEEQHILGQAHKQTIISYANTFDMTDLAAGHPKTIQQWALLGDPSLMIGGYQ
ncbi:peptidase C25 [Thermoplasmatales archaeon SM1-50]|nr:MAG: peptidase C25 [Thermoplasmatales archaeon SM1-50]